MDIFGKKRISELEKQLELKSSEIDSLKSDVRALERENYELKAKYEPNKGLHIVKSASNTFMRSVGGSKAKQPASNNISKSSPQSTGASVCQSNSSDGLVAGALIGAAVAFSLSDDSTCDSGSSSTDCSSD